MTVVSFSIGFLLKSNISTHNSSQEPKIEIFSWPKNNSFDIWSKSSGFESLGHWILLIPPPDGSLIYVNQ